MVPIDLQNWINSLMEIPDIHDGFSRLQRQILLLMIRNDAWGPLNGGEIISTVQEQLRIPKENVDLVPKALLRLLLPEANRYPILEGDEFNADLGDLLITEQISEKFNDSRVSFSAFGKAILADNRQQLENLDLTAENRLSAKLPHYLLNGFEGPQCVSLPHNLSELIQGICACIDEPMLSVESLLNHIKGPDFPGGGALYNSEAIETWYGGGPADFIVRADVLQSEGKLDKGGAKLLVKPLPFMDNIDLVTSRLGAVCMDGKIGGIRNAESGGTTVMIELKSDANPGKVIQQLYEFKVLQTEMRVNIEAFSLNPAAKRETLTSLINAFVEHRILTLKEMSDSSSEEIRAEFRNDLLRLKTTFDDPRRTLIHAGSP
jgi:DNA gyrase subunit A